MTPADAQVRRRARLGVLVVVPALLFALLLSSASARAADEAATAETLFNEANALVAKGRYADACPKLAESQRLEPAVGTQFNLADCYEHMGRTATAFALFNDVARIARAAGKFERERLAKERAASLLPKLAHVRLTVTAPAPGIEIRIDGTPVQRDQWSAPLPIDPGVHRVVASAPARTSFEGSTTAIDGATAALTVPELVDPNPNPRRSPEASKSGGTQRTIAIAVGGAGIAGLAASAIAGLMSISSRDKANEACPEATYHFRCPTTQGTDDWNSATTAGNVSTVGFVIGGIAIAGAAVLWFTAPSSASPSTTKVRAGVTTRGLELEGAF